MHPAKSVQSTWIVSVLLPFLKHNLLCRPNVSQAGQGNALCSSILPYFHLTSFVREAPGLASTFLNEVPKLIET